MSIHDTSVLITDCPACSDWWPGRVVQDGADLIAEHMAQVMAEDKTPELDLFSAMGVTA